MGVHTNPPDTNIYSVVSHQGSPPTTDVPRSHRTSKGRPPPLDLDLIGPARAALCPCCRCTPPAGSPAPDPGPHPGACKVWRCLCGLFVWEGGGRQMSEHQGHILEPAKCGRRGGTQGGTRGCKPARREWGVGSFRPEGEARGRPRRADKSESRGMNVRVGPEAPQRVSGRGQIVWPREARAMDPDVVIVREAAPSDVLITGETSPPPAEPPQKKRRAAANAGEL